MTIVNTFVLSLGYRDALDVNRVAAFVWYNSGVSVFTARCTVLQSAILRLYVVRPSVCPSVRPSVRL